MKSLGAVWNKQYYRSRTEAKWKMFFDGVGIEAVYEPEALDLEGITYIPDFFLTEPFNAWIEIKGEIVSDKAGLEMLDKCTRLAKQSERPVILNFHDPLTPICVVFRGDKMYAQSSWTHCATCGELALGVRSGDFHRVWCPRKHEAEPLDTKALLAARRRLYNAAITAHQHRFGVPRGRTVAQGSH